MRTPHDIAARRQEVEAIISYRLLGAIYELEQAATEAQGVGCSKTLVECLRDLWLGAHDVYGMLKGE